MHDVVRRSETWGGLTINIKHVIQTSNENRSILYNFIQNDNQVHNYKYIHSYVWSCRQ